jgi:NAD(P)-dependent dehydrogenase (short-subunit alcohol dehydrogenase family)
VTERHAGRVAFVTGAGSGIGRAIARRLATEGCAVACSDVRLERARETAGSITASDGAAAAFEVDVRDRAAVRTALEQTVARWASLHYVVNNAGIVTMSSLAKVTDDEWDLVVDINLKGQFIVTQEAAPLLAQSTPSAIVNLSTVEAEVVVSASGFAQPHYNASKGGVKMLTKACAVELAGQGTRVNAVAPGPVQTGFIPGVDPEHFETPQIVLDRLLVKRMGQPEDIAGAVSFLLSDDASFITGTQLVVDGGWLAR